LLNTFVPGGVLYEWRIIVIKNSMIAIIMITKFIMRVIFDCFFSSSLYLFMFFMMSVINLELSMFSVVDADKGNADFIIFRSSLVLL